MKHKIVKMANAATTRADRICGIMHEISTNPELWKGLAKAAPDWVADADMDDWANLYGKLIGTDESRREQICDSICRHLGTTIPTWVRETYGNVTALMLDAMSDMGLLTAMTM